MKFESGLTEYGWSRDEDLQGLLILAESSGKSCDSAGESVSQFAVADTSEATVQLQRDKNR